VMMMMMMMMMMMVIMSGDSTGPFSETTGH
jgi:hypothetical protein